MANDRYCRFRVKMTVNGDTHFDGYATVSALSEMFNSIMVTMNAPLVDFSILNRYREGNHFHYDFMLNGHFVALEAESVASPDGERNSDEPLEHKPSQT